MVFLPNNFVSTILMVVNNQNYITLENQLSANKHSPTTEELRFNIFALILYPVYRANF